MAGLGATFAYDAAVLEDIESVVPEVTTGVSVHSAIVAHYILNYGSEEQKKRWLPKMASGEMVGAIAMTEPGTGSDLQAVKTTAKKQGNSYVINGQKTFITNGQAADLVIVVARTGGPGAKGLSLIVVETEGAEGYRRGRNLDKIGLHASDTSELFFDNVDGAAGKPARQRGRQRLRAADAAIAAGAPLARGRRGRLDGARGQGDGRLHQGAHRVRQAADRIPEHRLQARRAQDRSR